MGDVSLILLSAKRRAYFCKSIAIEMGGVSKYFSKVSESGVDLTLLTRLGNGKPDPVQSKSGLETKAFLLAQKSHFASQSSPLGHRSFGPFPRFLRTWVRFLRCKESTRRNSAWRILGPPRTPPLEILYVGLFPVFRREKEAPNTKNLRDHRVFGGGGLGGRVSAQILYVYALFWFLISEILKEKWAASKKGTFVFLMSFFFESIFNMDPLKDTCGWPIRGSSTWTYFGQLPAH